MTAMEQSHEEIPVPGAWRARLPQWRQRIQGAAPLRVEGRITRIVGLTLEAAGCVAAVGSRCLVETAPGEYAEAEVVGFSDSKLFLMPVGEMRGLMPNALVIPSQRVCEIEVGEGMLGRVFDAAGAPLDGKPAFRGSRRVGLNGRPINPMQRSPIDTPLDVGITAVNALLTVGRGQRIGLFAGSGLGKSVLLGMMTRFTSADVTVVGLIGERGREVREFIVNILGPQGLTRAVVVVAPADAPPLLRLHGAMMATTIAEYFRDTGRHVLLLMDSLTRYAQAQREIGLAIGELPATKGYPPSVFARIPQLVERAGAGINGKGSITAFYTVLAEGDDQNDPVADAARATLDGHIVLSRRLADSGHYPAIDIEASVSRLFTELADREHLAAARKLRAAYSIYEHNRDLINIGAYQAGSDPAIDAAIGLHPRILEFLRQDMRQCVAYRESKERLITLMNA